MEATGNWAADLWATLTAQLQTGIDHLPGILAAIAVLVLGWLVARLLRRAMHGAAQASNRVLGRLFPSGVLSGARLSPFMTTLLSEIVFWSVLFIAVTLAARVAGLSAVSQWLDRIAVHLPNLMAALVIVVAGYLISILVRQQAAARWTTTLEPGREPQAARLAQGIVIAIALIMALDQVGIDVVLPVALLVVGAAAVAITFAISVALGARSHMSNVIGMRSLHGKLSPGTRVRIDGVHGEVLELTSSQVLLETEEGRALVPGRLLSDNVTTIIAPVTDGEATNE